MAELKAAVHGTQKLTCRVSINQIFVEVGIAAFTINSSGHLIATMTDGQVEDLGEVVGADGASVTSGAVNSSGELVLTLSDGTTVNVGNVKGAKGDTGATGATGAQGVKGDTGATGPKGDTGATGPKGDTGDTGDTGATGAAGTSVSSGAVNTSGELILTLTDNTTVNVGNVKGAKGDTGETGDTGATGSQGPAGNDGLTVSVNNKTQVGGNITLNASDVSAATISIVSGSLTVAGWTASGDVYTQTISISGVPASASNNLITIEPSASNYSDWIDNGVRASAQAANSITFTADSIPTNAISVSVAIIK